MRILLLLLLLVLSFNSQAFELGVSFKSHHAHANHTGKNRNESNYGVYGIYKYFQAGTFINTYSDRVYFGGLTYKGREPNWNIGPVKFYVRFGVGIMYGYGREGIYPVAADGHPQFVPYITPSLSFEYKNININTHFIDGNLAWSISYNIK